jgi:uridine kinase
MYTPSAISVPGKLSHINIYERRRIEMKESKRIENADVFAAIARAICQIKEDRTCAIAVCGPGGSGKTTTGKQFEQIFPNSVAIELDDYLIPRWERREKGIVGYNPRASDLSRVRKDIQELKECRSILKKIYDPKTGDFPGEERIDPVDYIFITGGTTLSDEFSDLVDLGIFLDASEEVQLKTRLKRDTTERDYTVEEVIQNMSRLKKDFATFIEPTRERALLIFSVDGDHRMHPAGISERFLSAFPKLHRSDIVF